MDSFFSGVQLHFTIDLMERTIRRGDIFMADLNPIIGSEQGGIRPVLILSNNLIRQTAVFLYSENR